MKKSKKLDFLENKGSKLLNINLIVSGISMLTCLVLSGLIGPILPLLTIAYFGLTSLSIPVVIISKEELRKSINELENDLLILSKINQNEYYKSRECDNTQRTEKQLIKQRNLIRNKSKSCIDKKDHNIIVLSPEQIGLNEDSVGFN